jgi:hypothetical protein
MFENYMRNKDKRLLQLFNKYDEVVDWITNEIEHLNETCGLIGLTICRKDFDIVTDEMENYFKNREEFDIGIDWNISCELFEVYWDC